MGGVKFQSGVSVIDVNDGSESGGVDGSYADGVDGSYADVVDGSYADGVDGGYADGVDGSYADGADPQVTSAVSAVWAGRNDPRLWRGLDTAYKTFLANKPSPSVSQVLLSIL